MNLFVEFCNELVAAQQPAKHLMDIFKGPEQEEAIRIFKQLRLPIPEKSSFVGSTEGGLIFHTDSGVVIRAEVKDPQTPVTTLYRLLSKQLNLDYDAIKPSITHISGMIPKRFVHDHILQPITSVATSDHIIEIVPGAKLGVKDADIARMRKNLAKDGIQFWDRDNRGDNPITKLLLMKDPETLRNISNVLNQAKNNTAYLPVKTEEFPDGFPVIADRLAAGWVPLLHDPNSFVAKLMGRGIPRTPRAVLQEQLYGPLTKAFNEAWPDHAKPADPEKMEQFWNMCREFKDRVSETGDPLLNASWTRVVENKLNHGKHSMAAQAAAGYQTQIQGH